MRNIFRPIVALAVISGIFGLAAARPAVAASCDITIDNDTSDWADVTALYSETGSTSGTTYYWDGSTWRDQEPTEYTYTTNIDQMADLENVKVCNNAVELQLYVDAQHPMFAHYNTSTEEYEEFGGEDSDPKMPQAFDYWMVYSLQKTGSSNLYYYGIHLVSAEGDRGLENGPAAQSLYQDDGDGRFNPDVDTLLTEFDTGASDSDQAVCDGDNCEKTYDQDGGLEVSLDLVNSDGEGVFASTDIEYGDTLDMSVAMIAGSDFDSAAVRTTEADQTDTFEYTVASVGVQNVAVKKAKRKSHQVTVNWDAVAGADRYKISLYSKAGKKKLRTVSATKTKTVFENLASDRSYAVKVRAIIGEVRTPLSTLVTFKTKKTDS